MSVKMTMYNTAIKNQQMSTDFNSFTKISSISTEHTEQATKVYCFSLSNIWTFKQVLFVNGTLF